MPDIQETGEAIGRRFHGPTAKTVSARVRPSKNPIFVSHVISNASKPQVTLPPPVESAYAIHVHHKPLRLGETWINGKHAKLPPVVVGGICIFDLETQPIALVREPLEFTRFSITRATLADLAYERGQPAARHLRIPEFGHHDPVVHHLAQAMIMRTEGFGRETDSLFADWIGLAFHAHIVDAYGEVDKVAVGRWSIAPWRLRDACDLMMGRLGGPLSIAEIAAQIGMTPGHFARAFRTATGQAPHQWLLRKRIERAKDLLRAPSMSLAEIAAACGFVDQSHFTRVFGRLEGTTPGRWRERLQQ